MRLEKTLGIAGAGWGPLGVPREPSRGCAEHPKAYSLPREGGGELPEHPCAAWGRWCPSFAGKRCGHDRGVQHPSRAEPQALAAPGLPPPRSPCPPGRGLYPGRSTCPPHHPARPRRPAPTLDLQQGGLRPIPSLSPSPSGSGSGCRGASSPLAALQGCCPLPGSAPGTRPSRGPGGRLNTASRPV